jgi:translocation protein SEC66
MAQNTHIRERLAEVLATRDAEREWWEQRKATIQADFMKELDEESTKSPVSETSGVSRSEDDGVLVEAGGPADKSGKNKKKKGKQ